MKNISYVFDMDGTLTPHRSKMLKEDIDFFREWMQNKTFYLVTGSDSSKVFDQIPRDIVAASKALFCCSGNMVYIPIDENSMTLEYKFEHNWDTNLLLDCMNYVKNSNYRRQSIINIEKRAGMLNVSTVGRQITHEQRETYYKWDMEHKERKQFVDFINKTYYKKYEATIGGKISIDIIPKGRGKSQILDVIDGTVKFFGDKIDDGNDKDLALAIKKKKRGESYQVIGPKDTIEKLKTLQMEGKQQKRK